MLNKVMLIGRLGRDPELRYTQTGAPVATLNVATDETYTDKTGNRVERTEWHRVTVFQRMAEVCGNYLSKGSLVYVEGSLQTRKWQDQQGQDRYTTEIKAQRVQFLDRKGDRPPMEGGDARGRGQGSPARPRERAKEPPMDEDLGSPFPSEASNMPPGDADMDGVPF